MPVTARLLHRLRETLGDEASDDLLAWWEEGATVNRAAVREIADLYFQRFDAHLERRLAELGAELRTELRSEIGRVEKDLANQRADLLKWMFMFWIGTVVPLAGLMIALLRFRS